MGNCGLKGSKPNAEAKARSRRTIDDVLNDSIHNPHRTQRQCMAWMREKDINEVYDVLEIIGQGSMGEVTIVQKKEDPLEVVQRRQDELPGNTSLSPIAKQHKSPDQSKERKERRRYACKTVNTLRMRDNELMEFINEVQILRDLDHPNIVQLFEVFRVKRKLWVVTELCSGGDLTARADTMTEAGAVVALEQVLRAVTYMHKRNVCHRDIKLENIMFASRHPDAEVKLIDFGLSNKFTKGHKMLKACGTIYTAAPELLLSNGHHHATQYTQQTDIWSIGVCAFVLLSKEYPFLRERQDIQNSAKRECLANAEFTFSNAWDTRKVSGQARFFVEHCLKKEPFDRWAAIEALEYVQQQWIPYLETTFGASDSHDATQLATIDDCTSTLQMSDSPKPCHSSCPPFTPLNHSMSSIRKRSRMNTSIVQGMATFALYGELKKTILMTMAYTMDKASMVELRELFLSLDTNGSGTITLIELRNALKAMHSDKNLDNETIEKLFKGVDVDKSGQIHYNEFLAALVESQGLITQEHLAETFDRLDSTGKGYITKDDLKDVLGTNYNESVVSSMMNEADVKQNGQVDYNAFLKLMFTDPSKGMNAIGNSTMAHNTSMVGKLGNIDPSGSLEVEQ